MAPQTRISEATLNERGGVIGSDTKSEQVPFCDIINRYGSNVESLQ
jgi:hypothetical protein